MDASFLSSNLGTILCFFFRGKQNCTAVFVHPGKHHTERFDAAEFGGFEIGQYDYLSALYFFGAMGQGNSGNYLAWRFFSDINFQPE